MGEDLLYPRKLLFQQEESKDLDSEDDKRGYQRRQKGNETDPLGALDTLNTRASRRSS